MGAVAVPASCQEGHAAESQTAGEDMKETGTDKDAEMKDQSGVEDDVDKEMRKWNQNNQNTVSEDEEVEEEEEEEVGSAG